MSPKDISILQEVTERFLARMGDKLRGPVQEGMVRTRRGEPLIGKYRKLFAFVLFTDCMKTGRKVFALSLRLAEELDILDEFNAYAHDWIQYAEARGSHRAN